MADTMNNSIDRRFDILKQKAAQDVRQGQQEAQKGLTRQFARLGGIGTGAFVKQQRLAQEAGQKQLGEAQQNIEFQKLGEQQRQDDIKKQMEFQTSERLGSQQFASGERLGSQQFARGERTEAQQFASTQAEMQRKYATGERIASQEFQYDMFSESHKLAMDQLTIAQDTFDMENNVNFLNARLQIAEGLKKGLFGFDDLQQLNSMFGIPTNRPDQPSAGLAQSQGSLENLTKLRDMVKEINSGRYFGNSFGQRIARHNVLKEAERMGLTPEEMQRAGITGY